MSDQPKEKPPRKRKFRWVIRFFVIVAILLIMTIVAGEIVFQTDLPRDIVVRAVEKQLGLRVSAKSLSTGWLGETTLRDVTLSLPLADKAFIDVPQMQIGHTNLAWLAIMRSLSISSVRIDQPTIHVSQDSAGRWNFQDVVELLLRTGGSKSAGSDQSQGRSDIPKLPTIDVIDASVVILDNKQRSSTISHLGITGRQDGSLVWQYNAEIPDHFKCTGRVTPGGLWDHDVQIWIHNIGSWVEPWKNNWPANDEISGEWSGQYTGRLSGWLSIKQARFKSVDVTGNLQIENTAGVTTIRPRGLIVDSGIQTAPRIDAEGGEIAIDTASVEARRIALLAVGGDISIDGKYLYADGSASLRAVWQNIAMSMNSTQAGDLSAEYSVPFPGQYRLKSQINSHGVVPAGKWTASIGLDAQSVAGRPVNWMIQGSTIRWDGRNRISSDLSGLSATITTSDFGAILHDLRVGNQNPIAGSGGYDRARQLWWLALDGRNWPVPNLHHDTLDVDLNVWGNPDQIHLDQFYMSCGGVSIFNDADYVLKDSKPLVAHLYVNETPAARDASLAAAWLRGSLQSEFSLTGILNPIDVAIKGHADGSELFIKHRPIGDLALNINGNIDYSRELGPQVHFNSSEIKIFDGVCSINGDWPVKDKWLSVKLGVENISLSKAAARDDFAGIYNGNYVLTLDELSVNGLQLDEDESKPPTTIDHLKIGKVAVDRAIARRVKIDDGNIWVGPVSLQRNESGIDGRAQATIRTTLADPTRINLKLDAAAWPYRAAPNLMLVGWANGKVDIDARDRSARGHLDLQADATLNKAMAHGVAGASIEDRLIKLDSIKVFALDGSGQGDATIDLDHPAQSRVSLDFAQVDAGRISDVEPAADRVAGRIAGAFRLGPSTAPRPLGPSAFSITFHPTSGVANGYIYGDGQIFGYISDDRFVLDDARDRCSQIQIAGGVVSIWGRISKHAPDFYQSLVRIDLHGLSLAQIFRASDPNAKYTPADINGQFTLMGQPGNPELAIGSGQIQIYNADLASWDPIGALYNKMNVGHDSQKPVGHGTIDLRLANQNLEITGARYYDRGTEVRGGGTIYKIFQLPDSPLYIDLAGALKPFSALNLIPGITDLDAALAAVQQNSIPIEITGTVRHYTWRFVTFDSIAESFRNFLVGDVRSENPAAE